MLNSLWGKMAEKLDRTEVRYCKTPKDLQQLISDKTLNIKSIYFCSDSILMVSYSKKSDLVSTKEFNNPIIASFVTCYARLKLLSQLELIQERILYFDTGGKLLVFSHLLCVYMFLHCCF